MARRVEHVKARQHKLGLRTSLVLLVPLFATLVLVVAAKIAFCGVHSVRNLDQAATNLRFAAKRLVIMAHDLQPGMPLSQDAAPSVPETAASGSAAAGLGQAFDANAGTARMMLAIKDLQVAAQELQRHVQAPYAPAGVLTAPFLNLAAGSGLPDRLQAIWDRDAGLGAMISALVRLDRIGCDGANCLAHGAVEPRQMAIVFQTGALIARTVPDELTVLSTGLLDWRERMEAWAYGLLLLAAAAAILSVLLLLRMVILPLIDQLEHAKDRLALQGVMVEKQVAARTKELTAMVTEANAAVVAKSTFLANMSHEIRTPMNGVLGVAALLERGDLNEQQRPLVKTILQSGQMLLRLIDDVLDTAKISAGRLQIEPQPVSMAALLQEMVALHMPSAAEKGLSLTCDVTHAGKEQVLIDPDRLLQILNNLVGNAIKFTASGSVAVRLRETDLGEMVRARIDIEDTGIGIAVEDQARIFKPFERVNDGMDLPGAGIGLALSHTLIRAMGGKLTVSSRPDEGARFRISIPLRRSENAVDGVGEHPRSRPAA